MKFRILIIASVLAFVSIHPLAVSGNPYEEDWGDKIPAIIDGGFKKIDAAVEKAAEAGRKAESAVKKAGETWEKAGEAGKDVGISAEKAGIYIDKARSGIEKVPPLVDKAGNALEKAGEETQKAVAFGGKALDTFAKEMNSIFSDSGTSAENSVAIQENPHSTVSSQSSGGSVTGEQKPDDKPGIICVILGRVLVASAKVLSSVGDFFRNLVN
jgi:hypothetical protein